MPFCWAFPHADVHKRCGACSAGSRPGKAPIKREGQVAWRSCGFPAFKWHFWGARNITYFCSKCTAAPGCPREGRGHRPLPRGYPNIPHHHALGHASATPCKLAHLNNSHNPPPPNPGTWGDASSSPGPSAPSLLGGGCKIGGGGASSPQLGSDQTGRGVPSPPLSAPAGFCWRSGGRGVPRAGASLGNYVM